MDKKYIVTKSNKLICANYNLSLQEQKIILILASMVQPQDEEFKEYVFKIKDFMDMLEIDTKTKYAEIPKITKDLMKKVIEIREGNELIQLSWLSSARYKMGEGTVTLKFDPNLKPYLLKLKEYYTSYKLENVLSLRSKYSIRIYEILKSFAYKGEAEFPFEELKKMIGANEPSYNLYANFKIKVILQAQQELKEKTDISFEFEEIKTGRKVTSIKFIITSGKVKEEVKEQEEEVCVTLDEEEYIKEKVKIVKELIDEDISDTEAVKVLEAAEGNINKIVNKYKIILRMNKVDNVVGALIQAIKEDWQEPKKKNKTVIESQYDMVELKKQLLGR